MAASVLSDRDLELMMRIVNNATVGEDSGEGLPESLLMALKELIPCDELILRDLNAEDEPATFSEGIPAYDDGGAAIRTFWAHYWNCLACCYPERTGDRGSITTISDLYGQQQPHDPGMDADMLSPAGIEREMTLFLPSGPARMLKLLLFRGSGSDFTDRDRAVLALLRPHLQIACLNAERRRHPPPALTKRQREVLQLMAAGYGNAQIARTLVVSDGTVRKHLENIFQRLDVRSRTAAVAHAHPGRDFLADMAHITTRTRSQSGSS